MSPRSRFVTLQDAINYWVLVGEVFRDDDRETAHRKGLDELELNYRPVDRILSYKFPPVLLQKNFQGLKWTDPLTMRDVRELVRDYFSYSNARERLQTANNLYRSGNFRACAEKLYIEQKGRKTKRGFADCVRGDQHVSNVVTPDSASGSHPSELASDLAVGTTSIGSHDLQTTDVHSLDGVDCSSAGARARSRTPACRTASYSKDSPRGSVSTSSSVEADRRKSHVYMSMDTHKRRRLDNVHRESASSSEAEELVGRRPETEDPPYSMPSITKHSEQLFAAAADTVSPGRRAPRSVASESTMESGLTVYSVPASMDQAESNHVGNTSSGDSSALVADHDPECAVEIDNVLQVLAPRAAALKANDSIRSTYRKNDDELDELSSVNSSEPPIKHQWTEENHKRLDLGECRYCDGFYSRKQGGGLTKHEVYWCMLNPGRRDIVRRQHSPRAETRADVIYRVAAAQESAQPITPTPTVTTPRQAQRVVSTRTPLPAARQTKVVQKSILVRSLSAQADSNPLPADHVSVSPVPHSSPIAATTPPVVPATVEATITSPAQADCSTTKVAKSKISDEDWEMVGMYMHSGSPAHEVLEMVDDTLQTSKPSATQPFHTKAFIRHLLHSIDEEEKNRRKMFVLKYFEIVQAAGVLTQIDPTTFKAILYLCEKRPEFVEVRAIMQSYLSLFAPPSKLKTWQFLSRMEGGVALVKRYCAITT